MAEAKKVKKNEGKQVEKKVVSKTNKKKEAEKSNNNIC